MRYHREVYIPISDIKRLASLTEYLNTLKWTYSAHSLDNLKYRMIRQEDILLYIRDLKLKDTDIFEYYTDYKNNIKIGRASCRERV